MKIGFIGGGRVVSWQLERIAKYNNLEFGGIYDIDQNVRNSYEKDGLRVFDSLEKFLKAIWTLFRYVLLQILI